MRGMSVTRGLRIIHSAHQSKHQECNVDTKLNLYRGAESNNCMKILALCFFADGNERTPFFFFSFEIPDKKLKSKVLDHAIKKKWR